MRIEWWNVFFYGGLKGEHNDVSFVISDILAMQDYFLLNKRHFLVTRSIQNAACGRSEIHHTIEWKILDLYNGSTSNVIANTKRKVSFQKSDLI